MSANNLVYPKALVSKFPQLNINVGGLIPLTTIDYPDHLSAVLFLQGCRWRCEYCHNSRLWGFSKTSDLTIESVFELLRKRQGLLDAVVISGGEPLFQNDLKKFINEIKKLDFKIGLHTSGARSHNLEKIILDLDWVGFDYKTIWSKYQNITKFSESGFEAQKSVEILLASGVKYELRTTLHPLYHNDKILLEMLNELKRMNIQKWIWQEFQSHACPSPRLKNYQTRISSFVSEHVLNHIKNNIELVIRSH